MEEQTQAPETTSESVQKEEIQAETETQKPPQALLNEVKSLRAERAELREKVSALNGQVETAKQLETQLNAARRDLELARAGLTDPEGIAVAELLWQRLPQDNRPAITDWFSAMKESGDVPRALSGYISPASGSGTDSSSPTPETPRGLSTPSPTPGTVTEQAPAAPVDAKARLQAATEKMNTLRRVGGTQEEIAKARIELQQALTSLRR